MKELQIILEEVKRAEQQQEDCALATIVKTIGSTYRRPGARMLVTNGDRTFGSISGGCLERDVCERAREVIASDRPVLIKYDSTAEADIVWGLGLGCNGIVHILIEPLLFSESKNSQPDGVLKNNSAVKRHLALLAECARQRLSCVSATVFAVEGEAVGAQVGSRLMFKAKSESLNQTINNTITNSELSAQVFDDALLLLAAAHRAVGSKVKRYELSFGSVDVFIEVTEPPVPLVVYGAGYDAMPLVHFAKQLGWHVTVVDSRSAYLTVERFPEADALVLCRPEETGERVPVNESTVSVVMTHNYLHDAEILKHLVKSPAKYIGVLGPKRRTERLLHDLSQEDKVAMTEAELSRIYGPIGLGIGADAPEQIALSIVAEVQAVLNNCSGTHLRDSNAPIHHDSARLIEPEHVAQTDQLLTTR